MNKSTRQTIKSIEKLRLPELQVRFAEMVGESTRSPNRKFLLRRFEETLEANSNGAAEPTPAKETKGKARRAKTPTTAPEAAPEVVEVAAPAEATKPPRPSGRFAAMSVEEVQAKYLEVVGRATGSDDRRYSSRRSARPRRPHPGKPAARSHGRAGGREDPAAAHQVRGRRAHGRRLAHARHQEPHKVLPPRPRALPHAPRRHGRGGDVCGRSRCRRLSTKSDG